MERHEHANGDAGGDGSVELALPASPKLVRIARLVASGVATAAGFDIDEVEDVRIAVDELCTTLLEAGDGGPLLLSFELGDGEVAVIGSTGAATLSGVEKERLELSRQILGVVADEHELTIEHGRAVVRVRKRRAVSAGG